MDNSHCVREEEKNGLGQQCSPTFLGAPCSDHYFLHNNCISGRCVNIKEKLIDMYEWCKIFYTVSLIMIIKFLLMLPFI